MEIFVDFGLFEILAASGLATLARAINRRPVARGVVLVLSIAAPAGLVFLVSGEAQRWIAALALGTSLVNASIIVASHRSLVRAERGVGSSGAVAAPIQTKPSS